MKSYKSTFKTIFSELLYYILLLLLVGVLLTRGLSDKGPKTFLGYSVFIVLTGSMSPEIPQGSLG